MTASIAPRQRLACRQPGCPMKVHGYPTYHTEAEWQHLDELGRRYYWRHRHGRDRKGATLTFFNFR